MNLLGAYGSLLDSILINCMFALSQYVVMRAGIFSLATAGFAAVGGYAAAILVQRVGVPIPLAWLAAIGVGLLAGAALSAPLARLRGVFQAIASIAMVQLVQSLLFWAEGLTGGAAGLNDIPPAANTGVLAACLAIAGSLLWLLGRSDIGRSFDTIREDETLAVTLGIDVAHYHRLAFVLSGGLAACGGAMLAFHDYSLMPDAFGFTMVTNVLAYVVLGGSGSVAGAIGGAVLLTILPEIARPFADNRMIAVGVLLMLSIIYLPHGFVDGLRGRSWRRRPALPVAAKLGRDVA
jgi:branched-chain amino acid transport system permease protein